MGAAVFVELQYHLVPRPFSSWVPCVLKQVLYLDNWQSSRSIGRRDLSHSYVQRDENPQDQFPRMKKCGERKNSESIHTQWTKLNLFSPKSSPTSNRNTTTNMSSTSIPPATARTLKTGPKPTNGASSPYSPSWPSQ